MSVEHKDMANAIRALSMDAVEQAKSGHVGLPLGMADIATILWTHYLKHDPADPAWPDRDRFVLSAGHGSMLLYALLHLTGYDLPIDELKNFRQWGSATPGHPEAHLTSGVETTTGPLGQGVANAVGMAIAEKHLAARFNTTEHAIVDHYTYAICSDGDLMEGISHEAASMAGHMGLGKLIYLYDDNEISIDGSTDLAFTEDVDARFEAYGWHVQRVEDGNDLDAVDAAIQAAKAETDRPSLISVQTHIGYGSPNQQDTAAAHGSPLGEEEVLRTKRNLGWPEDKTFFVPDEVRDHMRNALDKGADAQEEWNDRFAAYEDAEPEKAQDFAAAMVGDLPQNWTDALPTFEAGSRSPAIATRSFSTTRCPAWRCPNRSASGSRR